jgi:serine-type D-Ala-D-Ala carboxypeptidase/endopeptidase (penicillin-binding protein 4)
MKLSQLPVLALLSLFSIISIASESVAHPLSAAVRAAGLSPDEVGIYAVPVNAKNATHLLSSNADKAFNPASTMKLVTTYTSLSLLGADFRWKTSIYFRGPLKGDVLEGDLIFKGSGDPKFVIEDLTELVAELRKTGLREIRGDLVLDDGYFDIGSASVEAIDGDPSQPYNVKPSATLMNFKATKFIVSPGAEAVLSSDPPLADVPFINEVRFVKGPCRSSAAGLTIRDAGTEAQPAIRMSGQYSSACGQTSTFSATLNHRQFAHGFFKAAWQASGGVLKGHTRFEKNAAATFKTPATYSWVSPRNLGEVIRDINKFSNNVMTRQVLLTAASEVLKLPANLDRARRMTSTWLDRQGLNFPELVIDNGSGLSRLERISARSLARVLQSMSHSAYGDLMRESLPLVGNDGTMAKRLVNEPIAGRAWIKTGSLNDVRSIAGFVDAQSGTRYAVVMLINGPRAEGSQALQDTFLRWVFANG